MKRIRAQRARCSGEDAALQRGGIGVKAFLFRGVNGCHTITGFLIKSMHVPLDVFEGCHVTTAQALANLSEAEPLLSEMNGCSRSLGDLQFADGAETGHGMEISALRKP